MAEQAAAPQQYTPNTKSEGALNTSGGQPVNPEDKDASQRSRSRYVPVLLVDAVSRFLESETKRSGIFLTKADLLDVSRDLAKAIDEKLSQKEPQKGLKPVLDGLSRFNDMYSIIADPTGGLQVDKKGGTEEGAATLKIDRKEIEGLLKSIPHGRSILAAWKVVDGLSFAYNLQKSPEKALFDFTADHTGAFGRNLQRYFSVTDHGDLSLDLKSTFHLGKELRSLGVKDFFVRTDGRFELTFGDSREHGAHGSILLGGRGKQHAMVMFSSRF